MDTGKAIDVGSDFRDAFERAEDAAKFAERVSGEVAIPSVNQLRYALCHLMENDAEAAKRHCIRARYDAYEAAVGYFLDYVRNFLGQRIPQETLDRFLPNWRQYRAAFIRGRDCLSHMRKLRDEDKSAFSTVESIIGELITIRGEIDAAFTEIQSEQLRKQESERLAAEREQQDREDAKAREDRRRYVISLGWSVGGVIVGILGSVIGIIGLVLTMKSV